MVLGFSKGVRRGIFDPNMLRPVFGWPCTQVEPSPDLGICGELIPGTKTNTGNNHLAFLWSSATFLSGHFIALSLLNVVLAGAFQRIFSLCGVKFGPQHLHNLFYDSMFHHSQHSPAPTARDEQSGQAAPCFELGEGCCPWGGVCTGLIMIWKNV